MQFLSPDAPPTSSDLHSSVQGTLVDKIFILLTYLHV